MTDDYEIRRLESRNKRLSQEVEKLKDAAYQFRLLAFMLRYSRGKDYEAAKRAYDEYLDEVLAKAFK